MTLTPKEERKWLNPRPSRNPTQKTVYREVVRIMHELSQMGYQVCADNKFTCVKIYGRDSLVDRYDMKKIKSALKIRDNATRL